MPSPTAATDFSQQLDQLILSTVLSLRQSWSMVPGRNITGGWTSIASQMVAQLAAAQIRAARMGDDYVPQVLEELGIPAESVAKVVPQALAVGTESGIDLPTLLGSVPSRALHVTSLAGPDAGLNAGSSLLEGIVRTQVADSARLGASLRTVASPRVGGYVREVSAGACGRCLILAGRWYHWSSGFLRHPRCQCVNVPVGQAQGRGMVTDVDQAFRSMSKAQQDRAFTQGGAQAIRDGADINQVVNARRGTSFAGESRTRINDQGLVVNERHRTATTTRLFGRDLRVTTEGMTFHGLAGATRAGRIRLMPEEIYKQATSRDDVIALLRLHGYLL